MNTKLLYTLSVFVVLLFSSSPKFNCADAYTSASYGLSHSKKAFNAHNFDHQKYYAGRALEALEKTRDLVSECGCTGAMEALEDGIENLEEAMDPVDWKMGRYHTKRAMNNTYSILENLDICSMDGENSASSGDGSENDLETPGEEDDTTVNNELKQELVAFEQAAQAHLRELNEKIKELCVLLGCNSNEFVLDIADLENKEQPGFSSLEEAQGFYKVQSLELYQQAVKALQKCGETQ